MPLYPLERPAPDKRRAGTPCAHVHARTQTLPLLPCTDPDCAPLARPEMEPVGCFYPCQGSSCEQSRGALSLTASASLPASNTPSGQQLLPTPPLGDPAVSGGTAKTSGARVLQPDTSATLPPSPRVCCTTWRKGHRCHSCSHGGCAGRSCKRPVPRIRRRVRLSPGTRNKPRRLLWGQGVQMGPQQLLLTFRFIKMCYGLTVCRTRVVVDALFSFRLASLWHLLFPSTNYFLRFNNHQHTAISSSPYGEKSLQ